MNNEIESFFENAKNDPSLSSNIDIQALLNDPMNHYLEDKTLEDITKEVYEQVGHLPDEIHKKLFGYRFISEIYHLHRGKHIRWINNRNPTEITNGAFVVDIKFLDNGTNILCKNGNRLFELKYDNCLIFQKLSLEEQLILVSNN